MSVGMFGLKFNILFSGTREDYLGGHGGLHHGLQALVALARHVGAVGGDAHDVAVGGGLLVKVGKKDLISRL